MIPPDSATKKPDTFLIRTILYLPTAMLETRTPRYTTSSVKPILDRISLINPS